MIKNLRGMQVDVHRLLQSKDGEKIASIISNHELTKSKKLDAWSEERYLPSRVLHDVIRECETPDILDFIIPFHNPVSRHECKVYFQLIKHFGGEYDIVFQVKLSCLLAKDQIPFGSLSDAKIANKSIKTFSDEQVDREYFLQATCDFVLYKFDAKNISDFELVIEYDGITNATDYGNRFATTKKPPLSTKRAVNLAQKKKYFEHVQKGHRFIVLNEAILNDLNPAYTDKTGYLSTAYLYMYLKKQGQVSSYGHQLIQNKLPKYFTEENQEFVYEIADNSDYGIKIESGEFDISNRWKRTNQQYMKFTKKLRPQPFEGEINFAELHQMNFYMRSRFKTLDSECDPELLEVVTEIPNFLGPRICEDISELLESTANPMSDKVIQIFEQAGKVAKNKFQLSPYECLEIEHQLRCMQYLHENRAKFNLIPNYDLLEYV